jgi:hypothetical protein
MNIPQIETAVGVWWVVAAVVAGAVAGYRARRLGGSTMQVWVEQVRFFMLALCFLGPLAIGVALLAARDYFFQDNPAKAHEERMMPARRQLMDAADELDRLT